jgi:hypothetical protein
VDTATGLPLAWEVHSAKHSEVNFALPLIDTMRKHGFQTHIAIMDKGYDPHCVHGEWTFAGADYSRKATKWRCPTGECQPASIWRKASRLHPLIPRESKRYRDLYRSRGAVERAFGRLKNEYALTPLRTRGIERVALHADLTILATLAQALARARIRALPLAA